MRRLFLLSIAVLTACAPATPAPATSMPRVTDAETPLPPASLAPNDSIAPADQPSVAPTTPPVKKNVRLPDTNEYYFSQLLAFDGIPPVYDPKFMAANEAPLIDDELVIGITLDGQAKAYPVTVLSYREMVDDELAGIPILVTW